MAKYIGKLKEQHSEIKSILRNVATYIATDELKTDFIAKLKNLVNKHISEEDNELYVVLENAAKSNTQLSNKLRLFAKDWEEITLSFKEYLTKYSLGNFDESFIKETSKFQAKLKNRMMKEEVGLFSEYEKIINK